MDKRSSQSDGGLTEADLRVIARRRLEPEPSPYIFDPNRDRTLAAARLGEDAALARELFSDKPLREAAVLVPIVVRPTLSILFTQRTTHLPSHAGQIAFPGGKLEPEDKGPVAAALREAREEVGLDADFIETIGFLDSVHTRTGYRITPVVAFIRPGFALDLDYSEVEEAFEVPLSFLMDPSNHIKQEVQLRGLRRTVFAVPFAQRYIWGITAGIIRNMHGRLFGTDQERT